MRTEVRMRMRTRTRMRMTMRTAMAMMRLTMKMVMSRCLIDIMKEHGEGSVGVRMMASMSALFPVTGCLHGCLSFA